MTNPPTEPLPLIRNECPIYDQLVSELGDPFRADDEPATDKMSVLRKRKRR